eukprot:m.261116 g.261116  ORF g.261116 m.261116 type:complete len:908 (+) comp22745_c3_seq2:2306-5029(+)
MLRAVLLVCLVATGHGALFTWVGSNTNFYNPANWQAARAPVSSSVCQVRFGSSEQAVSSRLEAAQYFMGKSLFLKPGRLLLRGSGTRLTFTNTPVNASCVSQWSFPSTYSQQNDLACHFNYQVNGAPPLYTFCNTDSLLFPPSNTYAVGLDPNTTRVNVFEIEGNAAVVNSAADFSQLGPQFAGLNASLFYLGSQASRNCLLVNPQDTTNCVCRSSCPTPDMVAEYLQLQAERTDQLARQALAASQQNITKQFSGVITAAALNLTQAQLAAALSSPAAVQALASSLEAELMRLWGASNVTIHSITMNNGGISLTISGQVTATVGVLGSSSGALDLSLSTWSSTDHSNLISILQLALGTGLGQNLGLSTIDTQRNNLVNAGASSEVLDAYNALVAAFNRPYDASLGVSVPTPCTAACVATLAAQLQGNSNLSPRLGVGEAQIQAAASALAVACGGGCPSSLNSALLAVQTSNLQNAPTFQQQTVAMTSPWVTFASTLPLWKRVRLLDADNAVTFRALFVDPVTNRYRILLPSGWQITGLKLRSLQPTTRRRSSGAVTEAFTVQVSINYTTVCVPGSSACDIVPGSQVYLALVTDASNLATTYTVQASRYFNLQTQTYDWLAIQTEAATQCTLSRNAGLSEPAARQEMFEWAYHVVECGTLPRMPDGQCLGNQGPFNATVAAQLANLNCQGNVTTINTPAASSSSSTSSLPVIAGAAVGVIVLLVLVALVVVRRRRSGPSSRPAKTSDRTVVAFENPMYDDPNSKATPIYGSGDGGGLYDEPAMATKQNPIFSSREDLTQEYDDVNFSNPLYDNNAERVEAIYDNDQGESAYSDLSSSGYLETAGAYADHAAYLDTEAGDGSGYLDTAPAPSTASNNSSGYFDTHPNEAMYDSADPQETGYLDVSAQEQ